VKGAIHMDTQNWQQSSFCGEGNACLQATAASVHEPSLRESADPGVVLTSTPARMRALLAAVKSGELTLIN
jgi:hypothetical protein